MMKAKLLLTGFLLFLFGLVQGQLIQGTIKPGANAQEIEVWIRPDFTNSTEYLFQIGMPIAFPTSASPAPTDLTVALDPSFVTTFGNNYSVTVNPVATGNGGTETYFNIVLIRGGVGASNPQTWVSGTEYKVLTATFVPSGAPNTQVKLADYQDGGSDGQGNFYTVTGNGIYYVTSNSIGNFYASAGNSTVGGNASAGYAQTIETVPPGACAAPSGVVVGSITTTSAAISWDAVGGAAGYEYALTTNPTPPGSGTSTTSTSFNRSDLTENTTYYVHVRTDCGGGDLSTWATTSFTTTTTPLIQGSIRAGATAGDIEVWLKPNFSNSTEYLYQIGLPIAFPSDAPVTPTSLNVTLDPDFIATFGDNYTVTVNPVATNTSGTESYFNIVLVREGTGASNPQTWTAGTEYKVLTAPFAPEGAPGTQVKLADYQDGGSDLQGNFYTVSGNSNYYVTANSVGNFYAITGESEVGGDADAGYAQTIDVIPPPAPTCTTPSAPVVSNVTNTGATINWTAVSGAVSYEYVISTSATPPTTAGSTIFTTSTTRTDLTPLTTYYFYLRSKCGEGFFSEWVSSAAFTTGGCAMPVVTVDVNGTSAAIEWRAISNAATYEYALTTNMTPPTGGASTIDTTRSFSGLQAGTTYYFHVRTHCSGGGLSGWTTELFHTEGIAVYPNPVRSTLTINLYGIDDEDAVLGLFDAGGKLVMRIQVVDGNKTVDVRALAAGVYTLRYMEGGKKHWVRVIKR